MKTRFIFSLIIFAMMIVGCYSSRPINLKGPVSIQGPVNFTDPVLILSIPDWAVGRILTDAVQQPCSILDSLKALRNFDNTLFKAILSDSTVRYVYTRKFNPCCPCTPGRSSCCQCSGNTIFAAPATMNASVKINGTEVPSQTKDTDNGQVEFFAIPAATPIVGLILEIDGNGIIAPLQFSMDN